MTTATPPPEPLAATKPPTDQVRRTVVVSAAITALGGLLFGYDTGVISGALLFIGRDFHGLTSVQKELLTSILLVGAAAGALVAGRIADRIGRRPTVLGTAAVFVLGVLLAAVSYLVDYGLAGTGNWRLMFGLAAIPAVLLFAGMLLQPESAHWLIGRNRVGEARAMLARVRPPEDIEAEIADVRALARQTASTRDLLDASVRPVLAIGVVLAVFQQITGINTIIYYAPTLLSAAGLGNAAALLANVAVGVVNVGMTVVAIWLLDRTGRRPLLLVGTAGMAVGMTMLALTFSVGGSQLHGIGAYVAIFALLVYTGSFAVGMGPVFWLLISEIYPAKIRGRAMSVATLANWAANFLVTVSFLSLLDAIGEDGTFFLFASLTLIALGFVYQRIPETRNRSLPEIERELGLPHEAVSGPR